MNMYLDDPANHYYSSPNGCWNVSTLWEAAEGSFVYKMSVEKLNEFYDDLIQAGYYEEWDRDDDHRAMMADLSYPVIAYFNEKRQLRICDGFHRIAKAIMDEVPITYQVIELPEPDFYEHNRYINEHFYIER